MNTESYDEYMKFYDFSKQLEELEEYCRQFGKGDEERIDDQFKDENEREEEDDEWEDEDESGDEQKENQKIKEKKERRTYVIRKARILGNREILLPNGKILGNRQYKKYYR